MLKLYNNNTMPDQFTHIRPILFRMEWFFFHSTPNALIIRSILPHCMREIHTSQSKTSYYPLIIIPVNHCCCTPNGFFYQLHASTYGLCIVISIDCLFVMSNFYGQTYCKSDTMDGQGLTFVAHFQLSWQRQEQ